MHAAGDLARRVQARDGLAGLIEHLRGGVDHHAAHRVMDARGNLDRVEGRGVQRLREGQTAKGLVALRVHSRVPVLHRLGEDRRIGADRLGQRLIAVAGDGVALGRVARVGGGGVHHLLVDDRVGVAALLRQLGGGDDVAGLQLVDEALALLVDEDRAVAADALGDQRRGLRIDGRMNLNLLQVHSRRADGHGHVDAVAGRARRVGGHEALEVRGIRRHALEIRAEAAGRQDDGLRGDGVVAVLRGDLDAGHLAVLHDELGRRGVQAQVDLRFLADVRGQHLDQVRAHRRGLALVGQRAMDAHDARAAERADAGQVRVLGRQPVDGVGRAVHQRHDQVEVVDALAADHRVQREELGRVEVALGIGLVGLKLRLDSRDEVGELLAVGFLRARDGLLHGGGRRVLPLVGVLEGGLRRVHAARRAGGVAAGGAGLLDDDDALHAAVNRLQRRGHARAARADDHDVALGVADLNDVGLNQAGGLQRGGGRLAHGVAGHGRARNAVNFSALRLDDLRGIGAVLAGLEAAEAGGLAVALDLGRGDLAILDGQGHDDLADAVCSAGEGLRARAGRHQQHQQRAQQNRTKLFHKSSSLYQR